MKYSTQAFTSGKLILFNDHFVSKNYDCTSLTALATNGVIPAGTIIPANNSTAEGVLLNDVVLAENPNGSIVIHGFIEQDKLPVAVASAAITALKMITFIDKYSKPQPQSYKVEYDLNGATGTAVTDSSSPYAYGTSVTVKAAPSITEYPTGTTQFKEWNTKADGTGTSYAASATFTIADNTKLYAIYEA